MSRDYKLNKSELTRLKREQKLYIQYLPVLKLKQEQLQLEQIRVRKNLFNAREKIREAKKSVEPFIPCFSDELGINLCELLRVKSYKTFDKSVAGLNIKALASLEFHSYKIPLFLSAPWILKASHLVRHLLYQEVFAMFLEREKKLIDYELKKATQKVNLFEMVLIPKTKAAIKRINIALGDEQVASVSRGKIAKQKKIGESFSDDESLEVWS